MTEPTTAIATAAAKIREESARDIREPEVLLQQALNYTRVAERIGAEIADFDGHGTDPGPLDEHHARLLDQAAQLTRIAEVAATLARDARIATMHAIDDGLDELDRQDMQALQSPNLTTGPEAVQLRFRAAIPGRHMGFIGGREWIWAPEVGYVDVAGSGSFDAPAGAAPGKLITYHFQGRVVSVDGITALVVSDGGVGYVLPLHAMDTEPDE